MQISADGLDSILNGARNVSVAVLGDFCLDAYWTIDRTLSEVSVETGKHTVPVRRQLYSLGGAANIVANLCDLGVKRIYPIGVIGRDLFGEEMVRKLAAVNADTSGMIVQDKEWDTPVYGKLYSGEEEEPRVDFGVYNQPSIESEKSLEKALLEAMPRVQAVILNQQLPRGITTDSMIQRLNSIISAHPKHVFVVDSRNRSEKFEHAIYRFNAHEAARLCGKSQPADQGVTLEDAVSFVKTIHGRTGKPVFVSRGARGSMVCWDGKVEIVPGIQLLKKTDPVGAGDTSVSAISASLAAGATPLEAAVIANFASSVTVQKLQTTGTASPAEILEIGRDPDYIFRPELAGDPRAARYFENSEIEVITDGREKGRIRHALFDHDGTISTLRQGWEPIMEDMFMHAILGPAYVTVDESMYSRVARRVKESITKSPGIQTLNQMVTLIELVKEFGFVKPADILDPLGYKRIYNDALMNMVNKRVEKLRRGELNVYDFTMKGAVEFLKMLRQKGVKLYLASGTDDADVKNEAAALGYADLFDGGVFGATNDLSHDVKKQVIEKILTVNRLNGAELACFGDGPVELREGRKKGGTAVGLASDEVRRYGLNPEKRTRLICAGADIVIADYTQPSALMRCLFG